MSLGMSAHIFPLRRVSGSSSMFDKLSLVKPEPKPRKTWTKSSWIGMKQSQAVNYSLEQLDAMDSILSDIEKKPVPCSEAGLERLNRELNRIATQQSPCFLLHTGDCAETFEMAEDPFVRRRADMFSEAYFLLESLFDSFLRLEPEKTRESRSRPLIIGRIAGQYAKPRSSSFEKLPAGDLVMSYRGDLVNGVGCDAIGRRREPCGASTVADLKHVRMPDASRLLTGYECATKVMDKLRVDGRLDLEGSRSAGEGPVVPPLFVSHECLHLQYEAAFVRPCGEPSSTSSAGCSLALEKDLEDNHISYGNSSSPISQTQQQQQTSLPHYSGGAHLLWVGDRTRGQDEAHVEFLRGLRNPVAIKVGSSAEPDDVVGTLRVLQSTEDRAVVVITRMGVAKVKDRLPKLLKAVKGALDLRPVVWLCDPMHGNTKSVSVSISRKEEAADDDSSSSSVSSSTSPSCSVSETNGGATLYSEDNDDEEGEQTDTANTFCSASANRLAQQQLTSQTELERITQKDLKVKTRYVVDMLNEVQETARIHLSHGTIMHGLHLEAAAENVTECVDNDEVTDLNLMDRYETYCDPRLNPRQLFRFLRETFPAVLRTQGYGAELLSNDDRFR